MRTGMHFRLKYVPHQFRQMVGLDTHLRMLNSIVGTGRYSGILITGEYGTGKSTLARLILQRYFCSESDSLERCGNCEGCRRNKGCKLRIEALALHGSRLDKEAMKDVRSGTYTFYWYCNTRPIFIDDLDRAKPDTINQFINVLDTGHSSPIIFTATDLKKLPDPLIQRCTRIVLRYKHCHIEDLIRRICKLESIEIADEEVVAELTRRSRRNPRNILNTLDAVACTTRTLDLDALDTLPVYDNTTVRRSFT